MVSKVEFETIDTRSLELESIISHMTIIFEVRTIYRLLSINHSNLKFEYRKKRLISKGVTALCRDMKLLN